MNQPDDAPDRVRDAEPDDAPDRVRDADPDDAPDRSRDAQPAAVQREAPQPGQQQAGEEQAGEQPEPGELLVPRELSVRRAPNYVAFLLTGAVLGVLVAVVAGLSGPAPASTGRGALVGYLALMLGLLGGVVGGGVAVLLDRRR